MIRSLFVCMLLIIVFFSGMLVGIDREKGAVGSSLPVATSSHDIQDVQMTKGDIIDEYDEQEKIDQMLQIEESKQSTQKMAFFLEAAVKGFYEIIVEILYQISSLFI